jgi:hypothetical protein
MMPTAFDFDRHRYGGKHSFSLRVCDRVDVDVGLLATLNLNLSVDHDAATTQIEGAEKRRNR